MVPETTISKLQRIQKHVCLLSIRQSKQDSITECLKEIHWLPIKQRIEFKILTHTHKWHKQPWTKIPTGHNQLKTHKHEGLRSAQMTNLLLRPSTKCKAFADRSLV